MEKILFSGAAQVAIQGDRTLRLINSTRYRAIYEIIGFDDPRLSIIDSRQKGLQALVAVLDSGDLADFASLFNMPAQVDIYRSEEGEVIVELSELGDIPVEHVLWIAIGIEDSVPVFDYVLEYVTPMDEEHYAFFALYKVLPSELSASEINVSSAAASSSPWEG